LDARLKRIGEHARVAMHLQKYIDVCKTLGLRSVPDRTTQFADVGGAWLFLRKPSQE
jgi:hypothetical protein